MDGQWGFGVRVWVFAEENLASERNQGAPDDTSYLAFGLRFSPSFGPFKRSNNPRVERLDTGFIPLRSPLQICK